MESFRAGRVRLLIATDVAARGIDVEGVTHVFNYDIPDDAESYIHRIGRTGRAGHAGVAVTFVSPKDQATLQQIEKGIKSTLEWEQARLASSPQRVPAGRRNVPAR
jgi:ATP-dependent RNA helicase DeaD